MSELSEKMSKVEQHGQSDSSSTPLVSHEPVVGGAGSVEKSRGDKRRMPAALEMWGDTSKSLPELEYICLDNSWLKLLPPGSSVIKTSGHGSSLWSQAGKIDVQLPNNGGVKEYFIKLSENEIGKQMSRGEYESMSLMYKIIPKNVPRAVGWGTFESSSDLHYFLAEFEHIYDEFYPQKEEICRLTAELHTKSAEMEELKADNDGMFGFVTTTCNGLIPQDRTWTVSWEEQFSRLLRAFFDMEKARAGTCEELDLLADTLLEKVVPRLIRPCETGGNTIRPVLLHNDLYHGNAARRKSDGSSVIFDAACFWGHNEYEFHQWISGVDRFVFDKEYVKEYFRHVPPSEPQGEWEDRNELYFVASTLMCTILWPTAARYRKETIQNVQKLVDKFPEGYTGPYERKGLNGENLDRAAAAKQTDPAGQMMRSDSIVCR